MTVQPKLAELIAALPEDLRGPASRREELGEMFDMLARRPVPTGRVLRLWALGSMQARVAVAYGMCTVRGLFAGKDERERLRNEAHLDSAVRVLAGMGYLRGAIMKVGQTLASYPDIVPDEYVEILNSLCFQAPPMHFSLLREQVRRELGKDPEEFFAEFDTKAFAAASLGQVHRARLKTGEDVVVKIQYPNIARTIASDMRNLRTLLAPMRLMQDWDNLLELAADVQAMLERETDYEQELATAQRVRTELEGLDDVVVPRVYPELSTKRVLTMDFVPGVHLPEFMARNPSQERRDLHGEQIMRVLSRLLYRRTLLADPNPGNFLFLEDGRLGVLDFGCFRVLNDEEWDIVKYGDSLLDREWAENRELMNDLVVRGSLLTDEEAADPERVALLRATIEWLWEPFEKDEPFDFGDSAYMQRGFDAFANLLKKYRYHRTMPVFLWSNRELIGVRALAYALGARVNLKRLNDEQRAQVRI